MAKQGEGDARWIVKERDDGTNCNNWHWSEKNLTEWSKEQLTNLLVGIFSLEESSGKGWCKITSLDACTGDVTVQSRKQKKFPLYELEIKLKWEGQLWDEEGKVVAEAKGLITIPDLSEETYDDLEMTVVCDEETNEKRPLKESMRKEGSKRIREACMKFVKSLKDSITSGSDAGLAKKKAAPADRSNNTYVTNEAEKKLSSKALTIKYSFVPPPPVIYETLLDTERIRGATASDASMSKDVGGKLMMFSGSVEGENLSLTPFSSSTKTAQIVWKWRFATWAPGHYSTVTIDLNDKDGSTALTLTQVGVPEEEMERTEKGWKGLLFDRLKAMMGGTVLA